MILVIEDFINLKLSRMDLYNDYSMQSLFPTEPFEIKYGNTSLYITPIDLSDRFAFQVSFSSSRKTLLVIRAVDHKGNRFWTSMPEGRQKEAEGVGTLIEDYIRQHESE